MNTIVLGSSYDPWRNLGLEELLFDQHQEGVTFYLWQNQNTVVIGKNQNAWKECRVSLLESEGGKLARRSSGGGAVFHDLGNLNFTFIAHRAVYDVPRQLSVIQQAVQSFGVETEFTGRNDLVLRPGGEKFSGNAFRLGKNLGMHHGTILMHVDMEKLSRYLTPSQVKLESKGVQSVRSRVKNIAECSPAINLETMKAALVTAFIREYGAGETFAEEHFDGENLRALEAKYASWDWRLGHTPVFDVTLENRFVWGEITLHLSFTNGKVTDARVYSDAMDMAFVESIAPVLVGCPMSAPELAQRIRSLEQPEAEELAAWLENQQF